MLYSHQSLAEFVVQLFLKLGCPPDQAKAGAEVLIDADLKGLDSHGVARLPGYVRLWKKDRLNAAPDIKVVHETPSTAVIDGDGVIREPTEFIDVDNKGRNSLTDPNTGRRHRQLNAIIIDDVPLDTRSSLYVQYGDWFAMSCGLMCCTVIIGNWLPRRRKEQSMTDAG
mgnify:CR=1 FL=1